VQLAPGSLIGSARGMARTLGELAGLSSSSFATPLTPCDQVAVTIASDPRLPDAPTASPSARSGRGNVHGGRPPGGAGNAVAEERAALGQLVEARDSALAVTRYPQEAKEPAPFRAARTRGDELPRRSVAHRSRATQRARAARSRAANGSSSAAAADALRAPRAAR